MAVYDGPPATTCLGPPAGYEDYANTPFVFTGSLEGCLYFKIDASKDNGAPSGVYLEEGREVFVGSLNGGPDGLFNTTYKCESKWVPDVTTGHEVEGRCQHKIVARSGIGGFVGATGRFDFKDVVSDGTVLYRDHITL